MTSRCVPSDDRQEVKEGAKKREKEANEEGRRGRDVSTLKYLIKFGGDLIRAPLLCTKSLQAEVTRSNKSRLDGPVPFTLCFGSRFSSNSLQHVGCVNFERILDRPFCSGSPARDPMEKSRRDVGRL